MKFKECGLIQELFPLYAENLLREDSAEAIRQHLDGCPGCAREWESFRRPLPDPLLQENLLPEEAAENRLFSRLRKTAIAAVLLVVLGGAGIAYASYHAGKHVGLDDPSYRFAQELGLFTEIHQSKTVGDYLVKLEKGLFDSTRSVLFISFSSSVKDIPQLIVRDENGQEYQQKSGRGWQNKYFMFEFEPLLLEARNITCAVSLQEKPADPGESTVPDAEFTIPVDMVKTAQYTTIVYPNQERELADLRITLDKTVLGVSETEFRVRFDWPLDGSVAGIGFSNGMAYFPTSVRKMPETTAPPPGGGAPPPGGMMPGYAASCGIYYRPDDPPENRPALYDMSGRQEVSAEEGEYRTTQFPCQVLAILKFAPIKQGTKQLEMLLPPLHLYKKAENTPGLQLIFKDKNELNLEQSLDLSQGKLIVEKAWLEHDQLFLSYRIESSPETQYLLPHFKLTDLQNMKQGQMRFDRQDSRVVSFSLLNKEAKEFKLQLDSLGQPLPREKFILDLQE